MTLNRARLMKLLVEKPAIPFSEFEEIVQFAINSLDDTFAVRNAKSEIYDEAICQVDRRIDFYCSNIDGLKRILPPTGAIRENLFGKIGEFIEIKNELLNLSKGLRRMKSDTMNNQEKIEPTG